MLTIDRMEAGLRPAVAEAREQVRRNIADGQGSYGADPALPLEWMEREGLGIRADGRVIVPADRGNAYVAVDVDGDGLEEVVYGQLGGRLVAWGSNALDGDARVLITSDPKEALRMRLCGSPAMYALDDTAGRIVLLEFLASRRAPVALAPEYAIIADRLGDRATVSDRGDFLTPVDSERAGDADPDLWGGLASEVLGRSVLPISFGVREGGLAIQADAGGILLFPNPADPSAPYFHPSPGTWGASLLQEQAPVMVSTDAMAVAMLRAVGAPMVWIDAWPTLESLTVSAPVIAVPEALDAPADSDPPEMARAVKAVHGARLESPDPRLKGTVPQMFADSPDRYLLEVLGRMLTQACNIQANRLTSEGLPHRLGNALPRLHATFGADMSPVATGLEQVDELLAGGLEPSRVYVLGAPSSTGKTTLAVNIATNIARQGRDVVYVSLEQDEGEILAKIEARMTWEWRNASSPAWLKARRSFDSLTPLTATEILRGGMVPGVGRELSGPEAVRAKAIGDELSRPGGSGHRIILLRRDPDPDPDAFDDGLTAYGLSKAVRRIASLTGVAPVVFVDYLQFLRPMDPKADAKTQIDQSVSVLATLARDLQTPVIVISALNRYYQTSSKDNPKDLNSFLGSGTIEYTADVAMILKYAPSPHQLARSGPEAGDRHTYRMDVDVVKARMGNTGQAHLRYVKPYDVFAPDDSENGDDPRVNRAGVWFASPDEMQGIEEEYRKKKGKEKGPDPPKDGGQGSFEDVREFRPNRLIDGK